MQNKPVSPGDCMIKGNKMRFCNMASLVFISIILNSCQMVVTWTNAPHGAEKSVKLKDGVELDLIYLEGGSFQIGSLSDEPDRWESEGPAHKLNIDGFWIGKYEVTQAQYEAVMGTNPSTFKHAEKPVEGVSWYDAREFCRKLSQYTDLTFFLPTEAQWEYACRAGTTGPFAYGYCLDSLNAVYNGQFPYQSCQEGWRPRESCNVGTCMPNPWGLYDMHGNVWEWCQDWFDDTFYARSPKYNPAGANSGTERIRRGGSWSGRSCYCRSANRAHSVPTFTRNDLGFRVVLGNSPGVPEENRESETIKDDPVPSPKAITPDVQNLLDEARKCFDQNRLLSPPGNNAAEALWRVLGIDNSNENALAMLELMATRYQSWGIEAESAGNYSKARAHYESSLLLKSSSIVKDKLDVLNRNLASRATHNASAIDPVDWSGAQPGSVKTLNLGDDLTLDMVYIAGGSFRMGSSADELGYEDGEGPVHTVELDGFWIGRYEVTQAQYELIMGRNPSRFIGRDLPVEDVSWNDAMTFCSKLSSKTDERIVLPTEAQWEYACRSGTSGRFCFDETKYELSEYAWYLANSGNRSHPVGLKKPNAWGLYDIHGNVWEWTRDWYDIHYYSRPSVRNPGGPLTGTFCVDRGGGFDGPINFCRAAIRGRLVPAEKQSNLGFRIVR